MKKGFIVNSFHEKSICDDLKMLWRDKQFTDVTLQCDDGQVIQAHKVILSSCSSFFYNILKEQEKEMISIIKTEIPHVYLHLLMTFIYIGECEMEVNEMEKFLEYGKYLDIKSLIKLTCGYNETKSVQEENYQSTVDKDEKAEKDILRHEFERLPGKLKNKTVIPNSSTYSCTMCSFESKRPDRLEYHKLNQHMGVKYSCDLCTYEAKTPSKVAAHKRFKHEGITINCEKCDYKAENRSRLKKHLIKPCNQKPIGTIYDCERCDFKTLNKKKLRGHTLSAHEKFKCEFCKASFTRTIRLKKHMRSAHKNTKQKIQCLVCLKPCRSISTLKNHMETKHRSPIKLAKTITTKEKTSEAKTSSFTCKLCDLTVKNKMQMVMHSQYKHNIKFK